MAEAQSAHRQDLERSVITGDILKSHRGLWAGLAIALSAIAGACYVTVSGWPAAGIAIGGTPLIGLVALFVKVSDKRKEELAEKSEKQKRKK